MREGESDGGGSRFEDKEEIPSGSEAVLAAYIKDLMVYFFFYVIQLVI